MAGAGYGQTATPIEHWDGHKWTYSPHPHGKYGDNVLYGMSCVSKAACVVVEDGQSAESWNGTAWEVMNVPNGGDSPQFYTGVSCVTATLCKAVGDRTAISSTG